MKGKITKRSVEAMTPATKDSFLWDTAMKGFGLKVTPKGRRVYLLQYRATRRLRRYTIGTHGAQWTPDRARREAARLLNEVAAGHDPALSRNRSRSAPTVAELGGEYMSNHARPKKKRSSVVSDETLLRLHIVPHLGTIKVDALNRRDVVRFHQGLRERPGAANRALALLSKMMSLAEQWGHRPDGTNPCRHVERYKERARQRFLSAEELARLGEALSQAVDEQSELPSVITAIRLLILTGARKSEILTARREWIDWERRLLALPDSKTGEKTIILGAAALAVLQEAPEVDSNPYICPGEKPGRPLVGLQKAWTRIRENAGLDGVRIHDLRHSYAAVGASGGDSLIVIGALLGHRHLATTSRYAHLSESPVRTAAERISNHIDATMRRSKGGHVVSVGK